MLFYQTIKPATLALLKSLQILPVLKETRLVGGTALAMQLGHRVSIDLDFFGKIPVPSEVLRDYLSDNHRVSIIKEGRNINIYEVDGIKVDFVNYRYDWIDSPVVEDGLTLASIKDIAAMKVNAIIGRGTKKDFVDLYFLLRHYSLAELLELYFQKYPDGNSFIALKSISYFGDAESDPMPIMLEQEEWETMKNTIQEQLQLF